jgi:hypothetical protein
MVADPEGLLEVWADDWSLVENYRFGTRTCDFLICRRCGDPEAAQQYSPDQPRGPRFAHDSPLEGDGFEISI